MNMLDEKIKNVFFSIFDTETTGNNKNRKDKPIEVAIIKWNVESGFEGIPKSWLVDPEMLIHPSAIAVHGLLDEDVVGKPKIDEIMPEIFKYVGDSVLVAHNIEFDLEMLPELKEGNNIKIDTLKFAKQMYKIGEINEKGHDLTSHKMQELRYWLDVKIDTMGLQAHRAAADILVTGEVFGIMVKKYLSMNPEATLRDMVEYINAPIMVEKMSFGKYRGVSVIEAIDKELGNTKNNYFKWMFGEISIGKMEIDEDLKKTIIIRHKERGVDVNAWLAPEKIQSWSDLSKNLVSSPKPKI